MDSDYPLCPLSDVMRLANDPVTVDTSQSYEMAGVYSFGRGLFTREPLPGAETTYKALNRLHTDSLVLSQLKGWEGALALVTPPFEGRFLSPVFSTFTTDASRLDAKYLSWYCKQANVWDALRSKARGMGARRDSVSPTQFLALEIPLPPLDEQRRIVARIEELAAKIAEARGLRREAIDGANALFDSAVSNVWAESSEWQSKLIGEAAKTVSGQIEPQVEPYANLPHINGEAMQAGTGRLLAYRTAREDGVTSGKYHFPPGSVLYSKIRPYLRKAVYVPFEGICSADVYAFNTFDAGLLPQFFMYALIAPHFTAYANTLSGRTRMPKLNQDQLFSYDLHYPALTEQQHIVSYLDNVQAKVDALTRLQAETAAELDALLPAVLDRAFRGEL